MKTGYVISTFTKEGKTEEAAVENNICIALNFKDAQTCVLELGAKFKAEGAYVDYMHMKGFFVAKVYWRHIIKTIHIKAKQVKLYSSKKI